MTHPVCEDTIMKNNSLTTRRDFFTKLLFIASAPLGLSWLSLGAKTLGSATSGPTAPPDLAVNLTALDRWKSATRTPLRFSSNPDVQGMIKAVEGGDILKFYYFGGSSPRSGRVVSPAAIYSVEGFDGQIYLTGYCHERQATRTFRIDLMERVNQDA
jgi:hypothetical protein